MKSHLLRGLLLAIAACSLFTSTLQAQDKQAGTAIPAITGTQAPAPFAPGYGAGAMTQVIGCLFLLMALAAGGIYLVKNGAVFFRAKNQGPRKLLISETRVLGNRQFLVVAEYEDKKILIGVCPGRIDYLCPLGAKDETFSSVLQGKPE